MCPFSSMDTETRRLYMEEVGKLIAPIVPDDGKFVVIMIDTKGQLMQGGDIEPVKVPELLRQIANQMDKDTGKKKPKRKGSR